jgi:hypothetical protein
MPAPPKRNAAGAGGGAREIDRLLSGSVRGSNANAGRWQWSSSADPLTLQTAVLVRRFGVRNSLAAHVAAHAFGARA